MEEKIYRQQIFKQGLARATIERKPGEETIKKNDQYRYFTSQQLDTMFKLEESEIRSSETQKQLEELHKNQRNTYPELEEQLKVLASEERFKKILFGLSDHDLLFQAESEDDLEAVQLPQEQQDFSKNGLMFTPLKVPSTPSVASTPRRQVIPIRIEGVHSVRRPSTAPQQMTQPYTPMKTPQQTPTMHMYPQYTPQKTPQSHSFTNHHQYQQQQAYVQQMQQQQRMDEKQRQFIMQQQYAYIQKENVNHQHMYQQPSTPRQTVQVDQVLRHAPNNVYRSQPYPNCQPVVWGTPHQQQQYKFVPQHGVQNIQVNHPFQPTLQNQIIDWKLETNIPHIDPKHQYQFHFKQ
jgi:hypothetical protein